MNPAGHAKRLDQRLLAAPAIAVALLFGAGFALAHHGVDGEFNTGQHVTVIGTISRVDWINPHIYFTMYVKNPAGTFVKWQCETLPIAVVRKAGLNRQKLMDAGISVTVSGYLSRSDPHFMWAQKLAYGDGHVVDFGDLK
ncbi:MAG: DUF6152 family protein [Steroidobacteraceae bacterium]